MVVDHQSHKFVRVFDEKSVPMDSQMGNSRMAHISTFFTRNSEKKFFLFSKLKKNNKAIRPIKKKKSKTWKNEKKEN